MGKKKHERNREFWLKLRKKWGAYDLWKKRQAIQEEYEAVVRLRREKIRRAKTKL